jgi:hypothetical protein
MIRDADKYAKTLLVISPGAADAYLGLGTVNYVVGSLPGYKQFLLGFYGIHGDKNVGIQQFEIAADRGHYLPAHNSRSWSSNSPKTRFLPVSWPSSRLLLPWLFLLDSEFFLRRRLFSSLRIWSWYLEPRDGSIQFLRDPICLLDSALRDISYLVTVRFCTETCGCTC